MGRALPSHCSRRAGLTPPLHDNVSLLGVPPKYVVAMLRVASDGAVVAALGDGFAVPVVRDVLRKVLRVGGYGV